MNQKYSKKSRTFDYNWLLIESIKISTIFQIVLIINRLQSILFESKIESNTIETIQIEIFWIPKTANRICLPLTSYM